MQLVKVSEQVWHSPSQGTAIPEIFKYPSGTVDRQLYPNNTNPGSQDRHTVGDEQFLQPLLSNWHDKHAR